MEITEDLLMVTPTPPPIIRQNAFNNLITLTSFNNSESINSSSSLYTEVNFDEYIFRSIPNFDNLSNLSNLINIGTNKLPQLKRYNSESKLTTKSPSLKRINTF